MTANVPHTTEFSLHFLNEVFGGNLLGITQVPDTGLPGLCEEIVDVTKELQGFGLTQIKFLKASNFARLDATIPEGNFDYIDGEFGPPAFNANHKFPGYELKRGLPPQELGMTIQEIQEKMENTTGSLIGFHPMSVPEISSKFTHYNTVFVPPMYTRASTLLCPEKACKKLSHSFDTNRSLKINFARSFDNWHLPILGFNTWICPAKGSAIVAWILSPPENMQMYLNWTDSGRKGSLIPSSKEDRKRWILKSDEIYKGSSDTSNLDELQEPRILYRVLTQGEMLHLPGDFIRCIYYPTDCIMYMGTFPAVSTLSTHFGYNALSKARHQKPNAFVGEPIYNLDEILKATRTSIIDGLFRLQFEHPISSQRSTRRQLWQLHTTLQSYFCKSTSVKKKQMLMERELWSLQPEFDGEGRRFHPAGFRYNPDDKALVFILDMISNHHNFRHVRENVRPGLDCRKCLIAEKKDLDFCHDDKSKEEGSKSDEYGGTKALAKKTVPKLTSCTPLEGGTQASKVKESKKKVSLQKVHPESTIPLRTDSWKMSEDELKSVGIIPSDFRRSQTRSRPTQYFEKRAAVIPDLRQRGQTSPPRKAHIQEPIVITARRPPGASYSKVEPMKYDRNLPQPLILQGVFSGLSQKAKYEGLQVVNLFQIPKGTCVGEVVGELLTGKEMQKRYWHSPYFGRVYKFLENNNQGLSNSHFGVYIDANRAAGINMYIREVSQEDSTCDIVRECDNDDRCHLYIRAKNDIPPNTEITIPIRRPPLMPYEKEILSAMGIVFPNNFLDAANAFAQSDPGPPSIIPEPTDAPTTHGTFLDEEVSEFGPSYDPEPGPSAPPKHEMSESPSPKQDRKRAKRVEGREQRTESTESFERKVTGIKPPMPGVSTPNYSNENVEYTYDTLGEARNMSDNITADAHQNPLCCGICAIHGTLAGGNAVFEKYSSEQEHGKHLVKFHVRNVFRCDVPGCHYVGQTAHGLKQHKERMERQPNEHHAPIVRALQDAARKQARIDSSKKSGQELSKGDKDKTAKGGQKDDHSPNS